MKRYFLLMGILVAFFLLLFLVAEALELPVLSDPEPWLEQGGVVAAVAGVSLLVADVVLPVPSSLVMIAHGALFGWFGGTLLSLAGSLLAAWTGFFLGRRGGPWLARVVPENERGRVEEMIAQWGRLAVVVTRPVPLLAETVVVMAGASSMRWGEMTVAALLGSIPAATLYALTGATAAQLDNALLVFALVIGVAGIVWWLGRRS